MPANISSFDTRDARGQLHCLRHGYRLWRLAAALVFTVVLSACERSERSASTAADPDQAEYPNLVLITLDTLRADHLGCYGYEIAQTLNLDRFAASAVRFDLATTPSNNTLPSHAAILIGKYPHNFGVPRNGFKVPPEHDTLATILKSHGFETAAFISASVLESKMGLDRGFDVYNQDFDTHEIDQVQRRAPAATRCVVDWLKKRTGKPFFVWLHYFDPHYPYTPPAPYDKMFYPEYEGEADGSIEYICSITGVKGVPKRVTTSDDHRKLIALYDGEIAFLDAGLGEVFEILDQEQHRARTMVVVVADHGESLTEHNYYFDHGEFTYQPSMHVPLLIRPPDCDPSLVPAGVKEQVETIDIFPTVLAYLNIPSPGDIDGQDLTPLCRGEPGWNKKLCFGESSRPWAVEKAQPDQWANLGKAQFVLDYPWKLILTPYKKNAELYRLDTDPGELTNLATVNSDVGRRLYQELGRWRKLAQVPAAEQELDNIEKLRSLGYVE
ncbi:MAG: sulfatase [Phycisphaerae bacterium]|nr:sulfatase [Phycisphaerae bacterium]